MNPAEHLPEKPEPLVEALVGAVERFQELRFLQVGDPHGENLYPVGQAVKLQPLAVSVAVKAEDIDAVRDRGILVGVEEHDVPVTDSGTQHTRADSPESIDIP